MNLINWKIVLKNIKWKKNNYKNTLIKRNV